jgi:peptide/nickel transport system substrate-binding protein
MSRFRRVVAGATVVGMLIGVALVGTALAQDTSDAPSTTSAPKQFLYGDTSVPSSLNPLVGYLGTDYTLWAMTYDIPINFTTTDFAPDLEHSIVTGVETSADSTKFTYTMRDGMKWSDGEPFTANDVAWTLNYYKSHSISNYAADLKLVEHVDAPDDTHFVITATQPTSVYSGDSVFLYDYILPEHIWSKLDEPKKFQNVPAVGSGPFIISSYKQGQAVTLERNPYYWGLEAGLTPTFDEVIYQSFNDENQEAAALQNGEVDFAYFDSANILNSLKSKPNVAVHAATVPSFDELAFNTGSAFQTDKSGGFTPHGTGSHAAADPAFRRAVTMAIDKQALIDNVLLGYGLPANSPVQPNATTGAWTPGPDLPDLSFNPENAKAALTEAGYTDTDGDETVNDPVTGENVVLRYFTRTSDQNSIDAAPYVQAWLKDVGVEVQIKPVSSTKLTSIIEDGDYEMFHWGWYPNPDPNYILNIFTCGERAPEPGIYGNNDSYYCDPGYDKLYDETLNVTDPAERVKVVQEAQAQLYNDAPYVMLYYSQVLEAYRTDRVENFLTQPSPDGDLLATYGPFSFINITPPTGATSGSTSSGASSTIWILIAVAVIAVVGVAVLMSRRKDRDEDEA